MLRSTSLVVSLASGAFAAVANVCVQQPYGLMLDFRDYEPAKAYCAPHFPAQTITSTLPPRCLTTTSTAILGTSTVTTTSASPCPMLLESQERDVQLERRQGWGEHGWGEHGWWHGHSGWWHHAEHAPYCESSKDCPHGDVCWHEEHHWWWHWGNDYWWTGGYEGWWGGEGKWHRPEHGQCVPRKHHSHPAPPPPKPPPAPESGYPMPTKNHPAPSGEPMPTHNKPAPWHGGGGWGGHWGGGHWKRDAMATQSVAWKDYQANLVECGYDCIQTACSCVAATKTEYRTPVPTCTETRTKETVVHITSTVVVAPTGCDHEDLRRKA